MNFVFELDWNELDYNWITMNRTEIEYVLKLYLDQTMFASNWISLNLFGLYVKWLQMLLLLIGATQIQWIGCA